MIDHQEQVNPTQYRRWADRFKQLGFHPGDRNGCSLWTADGIYYFFADAHQNEPGIYPSDIQLICVGALPFTPFELSRMVEGYWVLSIGTIPAAPDAHPGIRQILIERGIWDVRLRAYSKADRPSVPPIQPTVMRDRPMIDQIMVESEAEAELSRIITETIERKRKNSIPRKQDRSGRKRR